MISKMLEIYHPCECAWRYCSECSYQPEGKRPKKCDDVINFPKDCPLPTVDQSRTEVIPAKDGVRLTIAIATRVAGVSVRE